MKLVFFGTSNVALPILEALRKEHEIAAVVTTPDVKVGRRQEMEESPVSALAADLGLLTFKPENVKDNREFLGQLKNLCLPSPSPSPDGRGMGPAGVELFVVVAYGKILPMDIISAPKYKTINVHFSVLPKYRGASPIQAALLNGDEQTGTSIFLLDKNVDDGLLLTQEIVNIDPDDNFFTLSDKLARRSANIINQTISDYVSGKITPLPQDEDSVSYCKIVSKADGKVDWNKSATEIYNQFRAFYIWPGIWTTWKGQNLKITECITTELQNGDTTENYRNLDPGTVIADGVVICGNNTKLKINRLQLAGKNEVSITEFLNGYKDFIGSSLNR